MHTSNWKLITLAMTAATLVGAALDAQAHTRFRVPVVEENTGHYNDAVIVHGCENPTDGTRTIDTLGSVIVFPDKDTPIIKKRAAGSTGAYEIHDGPLADFVSNWGNPVTIVQDASLFQFQEHIKDPQGNKIGFWSGGGRALTAGNRGLLPFWMAGVVINPESCAKSVTFVAAIADICEITDVAGINNSTAMVWIEAVESKFEKKDGVGYNAPATLKINRVSSLPESCGDGLDVKVVPSAEQLDRDFNIKYQGHHIWPAETHNH